MPQKIVPRGVVHGIGNIHRRRQVHVARANQIFAVHVHVRNADCKAVRDFALYVQAGLLDFWCLEIGSERGQVRFKELRQPRWRSTNNGVYLAIHQRIRILRENLAS